MTQRLPGPLLSHHFHRSIHSAIPFLSHFLCFCLILGIFTGCWGTMLYPGRGKEWNKKLKKANGRKFSRWLMAIEVNICVQKSRETPWVICSSRQCKGRQIYDSQRWINRCRRGQRHTVHIRCCWGRLLSREGREKKMLNIFGQRENIIFSTVNCVFGAQTESGFCPFAQRYPTVFSYRTTLEKKTAGSLNSINCRPNPCTSRARKRNRRWGQWVAGTVMNNTQLTGVTRKLYFRLLSRWTWAHDGPIECARLEPKVEM